MRRCRVATCFFAGLLAVGLMTATMPALAAAPANPTTETPKGGVPTTGAKPDIAQNKPDGKKGADEPALLTADELVSDESLGLVIARGHVELSRGGHTVHASTVTFNQKTKVVIATGDVKLFEPNGEVMFSDYAELTDDLREGFIHNVRMIMNDNSRAAGTEAERTGGRYTRMNHVTYSPCYLCKGHPEEPPVWQIRANKAVHDNVDKDVRYTDAYIDVLGTPVFYTPYFSHADPTVKRRSGFMYPMYGSTTGLGFFIRDSYYFDIKPDLDATMETTMYSRHLPMLGGEVRKRFEQGYAQLAGSIIYADDNFQQTSSNRAIPQSWRGYMTGTARFDITDSWRVGGDLNAASDVNFMRQFYGYKSSILTSRAFGEGFFSRNYAGIQSLRFHDLRVGNPQKAPVAAPLARYSMLGEPDSLWGGRWSMESGLVGLTRLTGANSTRASFEPGWSRTLESETGLVTTLTGRLRGDAWSFSEYQRNPAMSALDRGGEYRALPQGQAKFSYPLMRNGESSQQIIEPMAALTVAPRVSNKNRFPNEDSLDVAFDDSSLFAFNRFVGSDKQEGGQRASYGIRTGVFGFNEGAASAFFGQEYRLSSDRPYDAGTGLETRHSDYVGRFDLSPAPWLYTNYRFSNRSNDLTSRRSSVTAAVGKPQLSFSTGYSYDHDLPDANNLALLRPNETIGFGVSSQMTRYWAATFNITDALTPNPGLRNSSFILSYGDECVLAQAIVNMDFTDANGTGPSQGIYFRAVLKNLGEFTSPGINPGVFGGSSNTSNR